MLGKKKNEVEEELPKIEEDEKTEIQDARLILEDKEEILKYTLEEFNQQYNGIFKPEDLEKIDADVISLNLLYGIFAELRIIRELQSKKK